MKTVGDKLDAFEITCVKPGFNFHEENGESAFIEVTDKTFLDGDLFKGKWKVIYFYPKDFTFVCPTEIIEFNNLVGELTKRDTVLLGGSTDNEFCKLAWRREHEGLSKLQHYSFADTCGQFIDQLGVRDRHSKVALRATLIIDPDNVIQHVTVNNLDVGRNPQETLRILDALLTDELCPCNRAIGGETL